MAALRGRIAADAATAFSLDSARAKVKGAQALWNTRDPDLVVKAYTKDCVWRNRDKFFRGHDAIVAFLRDKWANEMGYRLRKELFAFQDNRIAVQFWYEFHDKNNNWFRCYGLEDWTFDMEQGKMQKRQMSGNNVFIRPEERWFTDDVADVDSVHIGEEHWADQEDGNAGQERVADEETARKDKERRPPFLPRVRAGTAIAPKKAALVKTLSLQKVRRPRSPLRAPPCGTHAAFAQKLTAGAIADTERQMAAKAGSTGKLTIMKATAEKGLQEIAAEKRRKGLVRGNEAKKITAAAASSSSVQFSAKKDAKKK
ncbi:hypothetical protein HDU84_005099 [Entophlyctis sp. JEL0112]|nr:hypothetical protein HDU84_005099 [Entophlyctis sp. JEL0112]